MTLKLNGSYSGYTAIDAPAAAGSNTLVLPADNGSNGEFLQTNGSGTLDWAGAGKVLQYSQVQDSTAQNLSSVSSYQDATGLSINFTPVSASSTLIIKADLAMYIEGTGSTPGKLFVSIDHDGNSQQTLFRSGGTGSETYQMTQAICDRVISSGSTSARTIKIQVKGSGENYCHLNVNGGTYDRCRLSVMEIAA